MVNATSIVDARQYVRATVTCRMIEKGEVGKAELSALARNLATAAVTPKREAAIQEASLQAGFRT